VAPCRALTEGRVVLARPAISPLSYFWGGGGDMRHSEQSDSNQPDFRPESAIQKSANKSDENRSRNIGMLILCILVVWPVQYMGIVPLWLMWRATVFCWRVFIAVVKFAAHAGCIAFALLFLPIIGWIILFIWLLLRRSDKRTKEILKTLKEEKKAEVKEKRQRITRPWLLNKIKNSPTLAT
jgi:Flp pilus assembly protein TadB